MQTTLLGLAIAIILALVAALVAPLVVDWNHYRGAVEAEASRLTGLSVRVSGRIDARILPSPVITLRNVDVGEAGGEPRLRAGTLKVELGLGPLLRGEVRASELHLIAPQISLGLDASGAVDWPAPSPSFQPEALSISRFDVEDGRVVLTDARSGARMVLRQLSFNGNIRSFVGPFNGDGAFVIDGELYGYRISGGRVEDAGGLKIRLGIDPANHPLTTDIEGTLSLDRGVPQFEGTLALARPVGATLPNGRRVMSEPWHAAGKILATPASASLQDAAFQYGPQERAFNLNGSARLTFGEHPRLDAAISALQVDVDRALAAPDLTDRPPLLVIKSFFEAFVAAAKLPVPAAISVGVDALTVGGTTLQSLRGVLNFDASGWSLDGFEFRAPGFTQVNLRGRLAGTAQGFAFSGPARLESADADTLVAWLEGRGNRPSSQAAPLRASGDVTIASDRIAVERLTAALNQENVEGRFVYFWPAANRPATLDAGLHAAELDLDALATFAKTAMAVDGFALPEAGALALDVGKATFAGVAARNVKADVKFDAGKLQVDRLSIGELGGAALDISGRIDELSSQPRGQLTLDLDARALGGLCDIAAKFAPRAADSLGRFADRLAPAKVHAVLTVERAAASGSAAKLHLDGSLAAMRLVVDAKATGEPSHLGDSVLDVDSRLDADDGTALVALLGLDRVLAVDQLPGRLTFSAAGPLNGDLHVDGKASASGFGAAVEGTARLSGEGAPTGALRVLASAGDLRPFHEMLTGQAGGVVPASGRAALAIAGPDLSFTDLAVTVGTASVRGRLSVNLANPVGIDGDVEADDVDAATAAAMLLGLPGNEEARGALWSSAPIGAGAFAAMDGALTFKLDRAALAPALVAHELKGIVRFASSGIAVDDIDGSLAGGRLTGALAFRRDLNGLSTHANVALAGAQAATLGLGMNVADGLSTITLECDGVGTSPAALVGSLHGSGTITLEHAHFAGLDVGAFDAAIKAADRDGAIDMAKIEAAVSAAMANGRLAVPRGDAGVTITSGQLNLTHVTFKAQDDAELSLDGVVDLANAALDVRMTLSARPPANALIQTRPELAVAVKGPVTAPQRTLDLSALASWLTLRAAELQTRRLESLEANRRNDALAPVVHPDSPTVRIAPPGGVVESIPVPGLSEKRTRGAERLQPSAAPSVIPPDQGRSGSASHERGAAPLLPGPLVITPIKPAAASPAD